MNFYELAQTNKWSPDESVYILQRLIEAKEEARGLLAALLNETDPNKIRFSPDKSDMEKVGFLFGYTFGRIKDGWEATKDRTKNIESIKENCPSFNDYYEKVKDFIPVVSTRPIKPSAALAETGTPVPSPEEMGQIVNAGFRG
jgi:hypothetical protein